MGLEAGEEHHDVDEAHAQEHEQRRVAVHFVSLPRCTSRSNSVMMQHQEQQRAVAYAAGMQRCAFMPAQRLGLSAAGG